MTITVEQARKNLAQLIARAEAGEEILIARETEKPTVKLVTLAGAQTRLTRHPDLIGSTKIMDAAALTRPLPPEEWGELAVR